MKAVVPTVVVVRGSCWRVRRRWRNRVQLLICGIVLSLSLGCAPSTAIMPLEICQGPMALTKTLHEAERLKVAVVLFEDRRTDTSRSGPGCIG